MRSALRWPWGVRRPEEEPLELESEIGGRLEAHVRDTAGPEPEMLTRVRAALVAQFAAAHASRRPTRRPRRLAFALGAAAALAAISIATAVATSGPGTPFYDLRLALERWSLPAEASERAVARLDHLERRLAEARAASDRGNGPGVAIALAAYESQLAEAVGPGFAPPGLAVALERHRRILETMAPALPPEAQDEAVQALEHLEGALAAPVGTTPPPTGVPPSRAPGPAEDSPGSDARP